MTFEHFANPGNWPAAGWTAMGTWAISLGGGALYLVTRGEARRARRREKAPQLTAAIETEFGTTRLFVRNAAGGVPVIARISVTIANSRSGHDDSGPVWGPWRFDNSGSGKTGRTERGYASLKQGQPVHWPLVRTGLPAGGNADEGWMREWWTEPAVVHFYAKVGRHTWHYMARIEVETLNVGGSAVSSGEVPATAGVRLSLRKVRKWQASIGPVDLTVVREEDGPRE